MSTHHGLPVTRPLDAEPLAVIDLTAYEASIDRLRSRLRPAPATGSVAIAELEAYLEELEVGEEELRVQAEALHAEHDERLLAQRQYRDLFDAAPVGYVQTDANGVLLLANRTAREQLGLRPTASRRPLALYASADDRPLLRRMTTEAGRSAQPRDAELRLGAAGTPARTFLVRVVADRAPVPGLLWTLHDLSRERRIEGVLDGLREGVRHGGPVDDLVRTTLDALAELELDGDDARPLVEQLVGIVGRLVPASASVALVADLGGTAPVLVGATPTVDVLATEFEAGVRGFHGPVSEVLRTGTPRIVADLRTDPRWAALLAVARERGIASLLAVPVTVRGATTSVLVATSPSPGAFGAADVATLGRVTPRLGTGLGNIAAYLRGLTLAGQLEEAMDTRAPIDQAKGVLMAVLGLSADEAFAELRRRSGQQHTKVRDVALQLVADPRRALRDDPRREHSSASDPASLARILGG